MVLVSNLFAKLNADQVTLLHSVLLRMPAKEAEAAIRQQATEREFFSIPALCGAMKKKPKAPEVIKAEAEAAARREYQIRTERAAARDNELALARIIKAKLGWVDKPSVAAIKQPNS
jgi:hypothetical protein